MFIGFGDPGKKNFGQRPEEQVEPGWSERDLVKGVTHLYQMVNRVTEQAEQDNGLPCKAGCSWCCENVTMLLTHAEWMVILQYLKAADPQVARKVLRKALVHYKKNQEAIEAITAGQDRAEELAGAVRGPCPFLEDHKCSVYEARPHDCRMYGCSFQDDALFACDLVLDALDGKTVTLPTFEASARILTLYPRTDLRQTFAYWAKHHLPEALRDLALKEQPTTGAASSG
jgi:Fe-S-cluster containining protein